MLKLRLSQQFIFLSNYFCHLFLLMLYAIYVILCSSRQQVIEKHKMERLKLLLSSLSAGLCPTFGGSEIPLFSLLSVRTTKGVLCNLLISNCSYKVYSQKLQNQSSELKKYLFFILNIKASLRVRKLVCLDISGHYATFLSE